MYNQKNLQSILLSDETTSPLFPQYISVETLVLTYTLDLAEYLIFLVCKTLSVNHYSMTCKNSKLNIY